MVAYKFWLFNVDFPCIWIVVVRADRKAVWIRRKSQAAKYAQSVCKILLFYQLNTLFHIYDFIIMCYNVLSAYFGLISATICVVGVAQQKFEQLSIQATF